MRSTSPSSLLVSLTLHAFAVAVIFLTTVFYTQQEKIKPVIFELVAGPPTAPDELFAPALGNTLAPVKPAVIPVVAPAPAAPEPEVRETVKTPEPQAKEEAPPKPAPVKPKANDSIAKEMKKSARVSYKDYLKKHPTPKPAAGAPVTRAANVPRIDAQGIARGVRGGSTANTRGGGGGKAMTREEHSLLDTYFSLLLQELKRAHEPPPGVSDQLEARVTFDITASGAILNPRISKSSGDKTFDESVLDAFRRVGSIGPTPNRRSDTWTVTFRMKESD